MANQKIILDLMILDTHNAFNIAVADGSIYPTNYNPVAPTLEVKVPGYPPKSLSFVPRNVQILNSVSLGLTCDEDACPEPLPDGLYRFVYSIYPSHTHKVERFYLKVDKLYEKFDKAYLKLDIFQSDAILEKQDMKFLQETEHYIQGAIAAANQCNQKLAVDLYKKADGKLTGFLSGRNY